MMASKIRPRIFLLFSAASALLFGVSALAQTTLTSKTTVVLVPALVTTKSGEPVFTLKAEDFTVTDDGTPQKLRLEEDSDSEPLAMVVAFQTGGAGAKQIEKYRQLAPLLESLAGDVPHRLAVVAFDSTPHLVQDFTSDPGPFSDAVKNLSPPEDPDSGAAILDTLGYAVDLLRDQPPKYRRAIVLFSETIDNTTGTGNHLTMDQALRDISDTNTVIYSFAFSSVTAGGGKKSLNAVGYGGGIPPGPSHGCMANPNKDNANEDAANDADAKADSAAASTNDATSTTAAPAQTDSPAAGPAAGSNKRTGKQLANQGYDCAGLLLPPLALAKLALRAAVNGLRRNIPETVADLTGGEYYSFKNPKTIQRDLSGIANHVPNRYVLSFQPQSPHAGLHALNVSLKGYPKLDIYARTSYWADANGDTESGKP